jgi:acyl-coenzyme A thioesterase PaaI-like protein
MPLVTQDLSIYYLSQGKVGPFITNATVIRGKSDIITTRVEVRDSGANNRLLAIGLNTAALDAIT